MSPGLRVCVAIDACARCSISDECGCCFPSNLRPCVAKRDGSGDGDGIAPPPCKTSTKYHNRQFK
jgi:hypothetical protein